MFDRLTVASCSVSNQQFINWSVMAESLFALLSEFEIGDWSGQLLLKNVLSGPTRLLHSAPGDIYFWPQWSARLVTRLSVRQYFDHGIGCLATSSPAKVFSTVSDYSGSKPDRDHTDPAFVRVSRAREKSGKED